MGKCNEPWNSTSFALVNICLKWYPGEITQKKKMGGGETGQKNGKKYLRIKSYYGVKWNLMLLLRVIIMNTNRKVDIK